ncbi:hypothetical protein L208DRAFT_127528 [Tricholoma matsutake]|nr:hypothetical protein L208DRAFT_127528 [Tricholoma matsutake 945]
MHHTLGPHKSFLLWAQSTTDGSIVVLQKSAGRMYRGFLLNRLGAFHGHAHNRAFQLEWHPLYIEGTGHSEGEGCEHVFSSSNDLARRTRHATRFHHHQAIEEHFMFWDEDKYASLSILFLPFATRSL